MTIFVKSGIRKRQKGDSAIHKMVSRIDADTLARFLNVVICFVALILFCTDKKVRKKALETASRSVATDYHPSTLEHPKNS